MKVKDARKKVCPFSFYAGFDTRNGGVFSNVQYCKGNACMAWISTQEYCNRVVEANEGLVLKQGEKLPEQECYGFCSRLKD